MKHPSSRAFFAYWDTQRGQARAPDRSDIEPSAVRELLGDIFALSCNETSGYPFRIAGTRLCALFGRDLKQTSFSALFSTDARSEIEEIASIVAADMLPAVAGVTATSERGATTHLELLLLPFHAHAHEPISLTGLLAPIGECRDTLSDLSLTSWRYLHQPEKIIPRVVRKLALARGFMVYEGLR
jgi:hypothetical protein